MEDSLHNHKPLPHHPAMPNHHHIAAVQQTEPPPPADLDETDYSTSFADTASSDLNNSVTVSDAEVDSQFCNGVNGFSSPFDDFGAVLRVSCGICQSTSQVVDCPVQTFTGHTNVKNFVGLSVCDGYIATGSETNEVVVYHKAFPMPALSYKFNTTDPLSGDDMDDSDQFISSVCWRVQSSTLVAANSMGNIKLLEMVWSYPKHKYMLFCIAVFVFRFPDIGSCVVDKV